MQNSPRFLPARCSTSKSDYVMRLEHRDGAWHIIRGIAVKTAPPATSQGGADTLDGELVLTEEYACPYCSSGSFVKCGACERITCWPDGREGLFTCTYCDSEGEIDYDSTIVSVTAFLG